MSGENLKKVLTQHDGLEVVFLVEGGVARVDFRSDGSKYALDNLDDVIVFVDGRNIEVASEAPRTATARIGTWADFDNRPLSIMIRVDEFFDGWELD